jgi:hypothetical protein
MNSHARYSLPITCQRFPCTVRVSNSLAAFWKTLDCLPVFLFSSSRVLFGAVNTVHYRYIIKHSELISLSSSTDTMQSSAWQIQKQVRDRASSKHTSNWRYCFKALYYQRRQSCSRPAEYAMFAGLLKIIRFKCYSSRYWVAPCSNLFGSQPHACCKQCCCSSFMF